MSHLGAILGRLSRRSIQLTPVHEWSNKRMHRENVRDSNNSKPRHDLRVRIVFFRIRRFDHRRSRSSLMRALPLCAAERRSVLRAIFWRYSALRANHNDAILDLRAK